MRGVELKSRPAWTIVRAPRRAGSRACRRAGSIRQVELSQQVRQATRVRVGVLFAGGHIDYDFGLPNTTLFSPGSNIWTSSTPMARGHWYPSATTLGNGEVVVLAGSGPGDPGGDRAGNLE